MKREVKAVPVREQHKRTTLTNYQPTTSKLLYAQHHLKVHSKKEKSYISNNNKNNSSSSGGSQRNYPFSREDEDEDDRAIELR